MVLSSGSALRAFSTFKAMAPLAKPICGQQMRPK
jgi:hypothetical protein